MLGWGSSYGTLRAAVRRAAPGAAPDRARPFHNLNPLPANTGEVLARFERVLVAEMNDGPARARAARRVRCATIDSYAVTQGRPLLAAEMERELLERL